MAGVPEAMTHAAAGISIVYVTHRERPRFDWFADSFVAQWGGEDVEVLFVDGLFSAARAAALTALVDGRFPYRHVPPKPTPYNGPYRLTRREYFAAASARNTGIVHSTRPYIAFVDDASVLMPGWWPAVQDAARGGHVVAGAYQKHWEMQVADGLLLRSRVETTGIDSRWSQGDDRARVPIRGGQVFGASLGAPRATLLEVNGFDELCDSVGGEDTQLGLRLEFAGVPLFYSRAMLTIESEEVHRQGAALLGREVVAEAGAYMRKLADFGVGQRAIEGRCDCSHMVLDIAFGTRSPQPMGNYYYLPDLDPAALAATVGRFPQRHWFDDAALAQL